MSSIGTSNSMDADEMKLQGPLVKRRKTFASPTTPVLREAIGTRLPEVVDPSKALAEIEDVKVHREQTGSGGGGAGMSFLDHTKEENGTWILL